MGVGAYRFSIAWPRIQPTSDGTINQCGLDFYDKMIDKLLESGIKPVGTLFHWDLPSWAQAEGGWLSRSTSERFAVYADIIADAVADRVKDWFTLVEPYILVRHSHIPGEHAPGLRMTTGEAFPALHHLLLGHGLAVQKMRSRYGDLKIGITNHPSPSTSATERSDDVGAQRMFDALRNHCVPDAVLTGDYPNELHELEGIDWSVVNEGDMEIISRPVEYLGLTYYHPTIVKAVDAPGLEPFDTVPIDDCELTTMGWPIAPEGLSAMIEGLVRRYGDRLPALVITENGCSCPDDLEADGTINDRTRVRFLADHIGHLAKQIEKGVDIKGYFVWSYLDHFEWDLGYSKRWGIIHVNFETLQRTPKASAHWYSSLMKS